MCSLPVKFLNIYSSKSHKAGRNPLAPAQGSRGRRRQSRAGARQFLMGSRDAAGARGALPEPPTVLIPLQ